MAAIDFPNSPTLNQEFTANGRTWIWNGTVWANKASNTSVSRYNVSDTAPSSPTNGDVWFNSTNARTYVYYDSFWVESNPALDGKSGTVAVASPLTNTGTDTAAVLGLNYSALQDGRNAIINGAFDIWQRGTSFTNPAAWSYLMDRWRLGYNGSGANRVLSRQTHTPGVAPVAGEERTYFMRYAQTVAGTGETLNKLYNNIEDVRTLAGQTVTWSFYARAASAMAIPSLSFVQSFGTGGSAAVEDIPIATNLAIGTSWQQYSVTFTVPSISGKTVNNAESYFGVYFNFPLNTTFTFDLDGVQLEKGTVATPFKRASSTIQGELAACQRYYVRFNATQEAQYAMYGMGPAYASTGSNLQVRLPVTMRSAPTSVDQAASNKFRLYDGSGTDRTLTGALTLEGVVSTKDMAVMNASSSGLTVSRVYTLSNNNDSSGYIGFSAEL